LYPKDEKEKEKLTKKRFYFEGQIGQSDSWVIPEEAYVEGIMHREGVAAANFERIYIV